MNVTEKFESKLMQFCMAVVCNYMLYSWTTAVCFLGFNISKLVSGISSKCGSCSFCAICWMCFGK